jgi:tetratricopeptide (TPR) repeat protein
MAPPREEEEAGPDAPAAAPQDGAPPPAKADGRAGAPEAEKQAAAPAAADGKNDDGAPPSCTLGDAIPAAPASPDAPGVVRVTPDGLVLKVVLEEGQGELPALHARCLVHFVGRVLEESADTGAAAAAAAAAATADGAAATPPATKLWAPARDAAPFMDTRDEGRGAAGSTPAAIVAGRRAADGRESGLSLAAGTMRRGERALVYVLDPSYGYGARGSFSWPSVPPDARLAYDVRLVAWEPPDDDDEDDEGEEKEGGSAAAAAPGPTTHHHPRRGMLFEERLEAAERRRLRGNARFAEGDVAGALSCYAFALSYVDDDLLMQLEEGTPHLRAAEAVLAPTHLNIAACHLRLGDHGEAIAACAKALEHDPQSAKAHFRRGKARLALGQTRDAIGDLERAQKLLLKQAEAAAARGGGPAAGAAAAAAGGSAPPAAAASSSLSADAAAVARELAAARRLLREEGRAGDRVLTAALRKELGARPKAKPQQPPPQEEGAAGGAAAAPAAAAAAVAAAPSSSSSSPLASLQAMLTALLDWIFALLSGWLFPAPRNAAAAADEGVGR